MDMHNATGRTVPLTWLLLDSQLTVDLIENPKILLNIRKVRGEDALRVHSNIRLIFWTLSVTYLATELSGTNQQGSSTSF